MLPGGQWVDSTLFGCARALGFVGIVGFIQVRPGDRRIHSWVLGTFGSALGVVGFNEGRLVQSGALWGSIG